MKPKFITFEGCEGVGKSTQVSMLVDYLQSKNIKAISTREIGGTKEGEAIRDLMLHSDGFYNLSELLLIMAARYQHIKNVIKPALENGHWVVCDRFIDSTACYQSVDDDNIDKIYEIHQKIYGIDHIMPDMTFFLNIDLEAGLSRALARKNNNKFEEKSLEFHKKVYNNFKTIRDSFPKRVYNIDCNVVENQSAIHQKILNFLIKTGTLNGEKV
jgi:dTMP kinase